MLPDVYLEAEIHIVVNRVACRHATLFFLMTLAISVRWKKEENKSSKKCGMYLINELLRNIELVPLVQKTLNDAVKIIS